MQVQFVQRQGGSTVFEGGNNTVCVVDDWSDRSKFAKYLQVQFVQWRGDSIVLDGRYNPVYVVDDWSDRSKFAKY